MTALVNCELQGGKRCRAARLTGLQNYPVPWREAPWVEIWRGAIDSAERFWM